MEIGVIYSTKDPRQQEARNFVRKFISERGILANITETDRPVTSPTIIINGLTLTDQRSAPRNKPGRMYPDLADIARALEQHLWSL